MLLTAEPSPQPLDLLLLLIKAQDPQTETPEYHAQWAKSLSPYRIRSYGQTGISVDNFLLSNQPWLETRPFWMESLPSKVVDGVYFLSRGCEMGVSVTKPLQLRCCGRNGQLWIQMASSGFLTHHKSVSFYWKESELILFPQLKTEIIFLAQRCF